MAFWEIISDDVYERETKVKEDITTDIGAHVGAFTVKASKEVELGVVVAIEPHPKNFAMLLKNTKRLGNVVTINKALGSCKGKNKTFLSSHNSASHSTIKDFGVGHRVVDVGTLDDIVSELGISTIDYIKMDVEGAELDILMGAENALRNTDYLAIAAYQKRSC